MKTTIDIPDELYRRIKAKIAGEGGKIRDVTIGLFRQWIDGEIVTPEKKDHKKMSGLSSLCLMKQN